METSQKMRKLAPLPKYTFYKDLISLSIGVCFHLLLSGQLHPLQDLFAQTFQNNFNPHRSKFLVLKYHYS